MRVGVAFVSPHPHFLPFIACFSAPQSGGPIRFIGQRALLSSPFNKVWANYGRFSCAAERGARRLCVRYSDRGSKACNLLKLSAAIFLGLCVGCSPARYQILRAAVRGVVWCGESTVQGTLTHTHTHTFHTQHMHTHTHALFLSSCAEQKSQIISTAAQLRLSTALTTCRDG